MQIFTTTVTNYIFYFLPTIYYVKGGYGDDDEQYILIGWLNYAFGVGFKHG